MPHPILIVDDDLNLLAGLKRQLHRQYRVHTADGLTAMQDILNETGDIAAAIVDMNLPKISGLQLLEKIQSQSPDTVCIMLTGSADQQTAIDAINKGKIFRFFSKPCDIELLKDGLNAAIEQYTLVKAEQEILEKTLAGSVKVLVDVLSMVDPESFGRSNRIRDWAAQVSRHMKLKQAWKLDLAAMLSQLGNIVVPKPLLEKAFRGDVMSAQEHATLGGRHEAAHDLISNIPRLNDVADIVALHERGFDGSGLPQSGPTGLDLPLEARILKILVDLEKICEQARLTDTAFDTLRKSGAAYDPQLLDTVRTALLIAGGEGAQIAMEEIELPIGMLLADYTLLTDLRLDDGRLLLCAGSTLSTTHIRKIALFAKTNTFQEPVRVLRRAAA